MRGDVEKAMEIIQRDPQALDHALELLQNTVFSFSMKVCGHREDAEDTMQDVLLKTVPNLPRFDNSKALVVWLYRVAKNRCLMSRRRSKFAPKEHLSLDDLMPDAVEIESLTSGEHHSPELSVLKAEQAEKLRETIHQIPAQYRLILVLHDMEELSTSEIAEVTGLTEANVRVRLHRARLYLRKQLATSAAGVHEPETLKTDSKRRRRSTRHIHSHAGESALSCKQMFAKLSDYLDEALDPSLCDKLEQHMAECKPCEAFLATLKATVEQTRQIPEHATAPAVAAEVRRKLLSQLQQAFAVMKG
ncbi:MAG TPA: sigma-70 family RNA polymerase sigma factor [Terriglobales bacterium]|nr:sigma-70 family RNA polymerase sigma factor [Terriglobales bacterium]